MSVINYVIAHERGNALGLDNTSPIAMMSEGYVRSAKNCNLGLTNGYIKRPGTQRALTAGNTWGARSILGASYFRDDKIFYGVDGVDGRVGKESGGSISIDVRTGLSNLEEHRGELIQFRSMLYFFNGDSANAPFAYDGASSARDLGILAPTVDPTDVGEQVGGDLLEGSSYVWVYTYVIRGLNGLVVAESSPSGPISRNISAGNGSYQFGVTASVNTAVTAIRIYRTTANGTILFLEDEIANTTQTYTSDAADNDIDLNIQLGRDNSRLQDFGGGIENFHKPKYAVIARNRIFVVNEDGTMIRWSKIGADGPLPESFEAKSFVHAESKSGSSDEIVGLGVVGDIVIVLKRYSFGYLEEVGLPEVARAEDPVTYEYHEISDNVGAIGHFAKVQAMDMLLFLSYSGVYAVRKDLSFGPVSRTLKNLIRTLDFAGNKKLRCSAVNDIDNERVYFSVFSEAGQDTPDLILAGDYQQVVEGISQTIRWTTYEQGVDSATHPGWEVGGFFIFPDPVDGHLEVYFGNTKDNGQYYKTNTGVGDDADPTADPELNPDEYYGKGIDWEVVSRPYHFDAPDQKKLILDCNANVETASSTYLVTVASKFDLGDAEKVRRTFSITGTGGKWEDDAEDPIYGWTDEDSNIPGGGTATEPLIWSGKNLDEINYHPHRKCKYYQLVFRQSEANAPVTVYDWSVSGSLFGPT